MPYDLTSVSATFNTSGLYGQSLNGGRAEVANFIAYPPITVECNAKIGSTTGSRVALGKPNSFWMGAISNIFAAKFGNGSGEITLSSGVNIADSAWHHFALVATLTGARIYLDGNLVATSTASPIDAGWLGSWSTNLFGVRNLGGQGGAEWTNGEIDNVRISSGERYTSNFTPPSAALTADATTLALYTLDGVLTNAQATPPTISSYLPNDVNIVYSPYTWDVTSSRAKTINSGAYFRTLFSGTGGNMKFDLTGVTTPLPQISYRVDGIGAWTSQEVASTIAFSAPASTSTYQKHILEVIVKSTTETKPRWNTQETAVQFTGFDLNVGEVLFKPEVKPDRVIFFGDSITEGVRTLNSTATKDTDRNDASQSWAVELGRLLGVEYANVGFGGTGAVKASGSGSVPNLQTSYNQLWNGTARSFSIEPKLIVLMEGTNDTGTVIPGYINCLNLLLAACPTAKIAVIQPFVDNGNSKGIAWQSAIAACNDKSRVYFIPNTGLVTMFGSSSDNLHPYGWVNLQQIAPKLYPQLKPLLNAPSRSFAGRFFR